MDKSPTCPHIHEPLLQKDFSLLWGKRKSGRFRRLGVHVTLSISTCASSCLRLFATPPISPGECHRWHTLCAICTDHDQPSLPDTHSRGAYPRVEHRCARRRHPCPD